MYSKKYLKYILVIFLLSFLFINWVDVGWVFNYRVISNKVTDVFKKEDKPLKDNVVVLPEEKVEEKENTILIPAIDITAPIIFFNTFYVDDKTLADSLDYGTIHFPSSALPGQVGQTIILGHSAPANWPKIKYDWVFSEIESLKYDAEVIVTFDNVDYTYYVKDKVFLEKGEEVPEGTFNLQDTLVLISCWPPGKDYKRIAVIATL